MLTRLTPLDIKKKEFEQKMRGYEPVEVRAYLELASQEVEQLTIEKKEAEEKYNDTQRMLDHYLSIESMLEKTLAAAQQTVVKMEEQARSEAQLIVKEAEMKRDAALQNINRELDKAQSELFALKAEYDSTMVRMKSLMTGFTKFVENLEAESGLKLSPPVDVESDVAFSAIPATGGSEYSLG